MSLDEARDEQKEILKMINELEKKFRPDKIGRPLEKNKQNVTEKLIENAKKLYKARNEIIDAFKKLKNEESEESEEGEESENEIDLDWIQKTK